MHHHWTWIEERFVAIQRRTNRVYPISKYLGPYVYSKRAATPEKNIREEADDSNIGKAFDKTLLHLIVNWCAPHHSDCNAGHTPLFCHLLAGWFGHQHYHIEHIHNELEFEPSVSMLQVKMPVHIRFPPSLWLKATIAYLAPTGRFAHVDLLEFPPSPLTSLSAASSAPVVKDNLYFWTYASH